LDMTGLWVAMTHMLAWRTMADIVLMAAGLFFLYRTLLRLGTWKIVAGILVALLIYLLASLLDLQGIEWIFGNLSHVAAIGLIVIFQPELRKVFERAVSVRRARVRDVGGELSHIIVDAVTRLADQHRGAIVVLPGKEPIQEWISGGYDLDGKPSVPLLLSLFDPHSPGHDGALIIENGRFSRYGVRLPVSQSSKLSADYGTRHHAAMGLAEKSDALAILVSEERGQVAVFHKGSMHRTKDLQRLGETITAHWRETASFSIELPRGRVRWPIFSQMMGSLALAILFWATLIIAQGEKLEKVLTVPVEYTASPPHLVLVGEKQQEIRLHLAGSKSDLGAVTPAHLSVKIDLSKTAPGKQTFLITSDNIRLPRGVNLLDAEPSSVALTLAELRQQEVAVKPQFVGKLPARLKIQSVELNPRIVKVLSPPVEKKGTPLILTTTPIYLEGISENTTLYCKIIAPPSIQPADKRWPDVEVIITVAAAEEAAPK
jgi:diadenylate cyclase